MLNLPFWGGFSLFKALILFLFLSDFQIIKVIGQVIEI